MLTKMTSVDRINEIIKNINMAIVDDRIVNERMVTENIESLEKFPMSLDILSNCNVAKYVKGIRKLLNKNLKQKTRHIISCWQKLLEDQDRQPSICPATEVISHSNSASSLSNGAPSAAGSMGGSTPSTTIISHSSSHQTSTASSSSSSTLKKPIFSSSATSKSLSSSQQHPNYQNVQPHSTSNSPSLSTSTTESNGNHHHKHQNHHHHLNNNNNTNKNISQSKKRPHAQTLTDDRVHPGVGVDGDSLNSQQHSSKVSKLSTSHSQPQLHTNTHKHPHTNTNGFVASPSIPAVVSNAAGQSHNSPLASTSISASNISQSASSTTFSNIGKNGSESGVNAAAKDSDNNANPSPLSSSSTSAAALISSNKVKSTKDLLHYYKKSVDQETANKIYNNDIEQERAEPISVLPESTRPRHLKKPASENRHSSPAVANMAAPFNKTKSSASALLIKQQSASSASFPTDHQISQQTDQQHHLQYASNNNNNNNLIVNNKNNISNDNVNNNLYNQKQSKNQLDQQQFFQQNQHPNDYHQHHQSFPHSHSSNEIVKSQSKLSHTTFSSCSSFVNNNHESGAKEPSLSNASSQPPLAPIICRIPLKSVLTTATSSSSNAASPVVTLSRTPSQSNLTDLTSSQTQQHLLHHHQNNKKQNLNSLSIDSSTNQKQFQHKQQQQISSNDQSNNQATSLQSLINKNLQQNSPDSKHPLHHKQHKHQKHKKNHSKKLHHHHQLDVINNTDAKRKANEKERERESKTLESPPITNFLDRMPSPLPELDAHVSWDQLADPSYSPPTAAVVSPPYPLPSPSQKCAANDNVDEMEEKEKLSQHNYQQERKRFDPLVHTRRHPTTHAPLSFTQLYSVPMKDHFFHVFPWVDLGIGKFKLRGTFPGHVRRDTVDNEIARLENCIVTKSL